MMATLGSCWLKPTTPRYWPAGESLGLSPTWRRQRPCTRRPKGAVPKAHLSACLPFETRFTLSQACDGRAPSHWPSRSRPTCRSTAHIQRPIASTPLENGCADRNQSCLIDNFLVAEPPLKEAASRTVG